MQMHEFAQRGIASHWKYKSSEKFNSLTWKEYDWFKLIWLKLLIKMKTQRTHMSSQNSNVSRKCILFYTQRFCELNYQKTQHL